MPIPGAGEIAGGSLGVAGGFLGPIGAGLGQGIGAGLGSLFSGTPGTAISGGSPLFNDRSVINIAPVGVNLGEILRNFSGPPANGGFGLDIPGNKFLDGGAQVTGSVGVKGKVGGSTIALIGGALLVFILLKRRK